MNVKSNKGFSLIELMVTVGIIGIITMIAIPNFQKFQAKAKQTNARTELSSIYGMQKAFFTEYGHYYANLNFTGYVPDGYPLDSSSCPVTTRASAGASGARYYDVGFPSGGTGTAAVTSIPAGMTAAPPCGSAIQYLATVAPSGTVVGTLPSGVANPTTFTASAIGTVNAGKQDAWTINQAKLLTNSNPGL